MQKILLLLFLGLILNCNAQNKNPKEKLQSEKTKSENVKKLSGKEIVVELDKLDFFDITDKTELETVKIEFAESKDKWNFFSGTMRGETTDFTNNRFIAVDCETLFETGGLTEYLDKVKFSFEKLGLKLDYANEKSEQDENYWKHTIELNGTEYIAFNGTFSDYDWGIAYVNFIKMLNDQLKKQGNKNRFYPILCDNGGQIVLLTDEQFDFVNKHYPEDKDHPKKLTDWKKINGI